jgi:hypothetical protein
VSASLPAFAGPPGPGHRDASMTILDRADATETAADLRDGCEQGCARQLGRAVCAGQLNRQPLEPVVLTADDHRRLWRRFGEVDPPFIRAAVFRGLARQPSAGWRRPGPIAGVGWTVVGAVQHQHLRSIVADAIHDDRRAERWLLADRQTGPGRLHARSSRTSVHSAPYVRQDLSDKEGEHGLGPQRKWPAPKTADDVGHAPLDRRRTTTSAVPMT